MKHINFSSNPSFIVFRTDRIGDVVLSTQTAEAIKDKYPNARITFVLQSYTRPLFTHNPFVDEIIAIDEMKGGELYSYLKEKKFDAVIVLFSTFQIAWNVFKAKIPIRIGSMSKWWAIFFNIRIKQKRSKCEKNEAEYNLDLLKPLGITKKFYPKIFTDESITTQFLESYYESIGAKNKKLVIIHPGSGHSAKNWPIEKFLTLAKNLKEVENIKILITGNEKELELYNKQKLEKYNLDTKDIMPRSLELLHFLQVISGSALVITNSTGPLHCAVALGVPTISFFCPIRVCKPKRWGPWGPTDDMSKHKVFMPDVKTCEKCIAEKCPHFNCMDRIDVEPVFEKIKHLINIS